jgi:hypothetical protein
VCGCPECFCWSRTFLLVGRPSWPFVVVASVKLAVLIPWMHGVLCAASWCSFPVVLSICVSIYPCVIHSQVIFAELAYVVFFDCVLMIVHNMLWLHVYVLCLIYCLNILQLLLLFLIACICSLYLVQNALSYVSERTA